MNNVFKENVKRHKSRMNLNTDCMRRFKHYFFFITLFMSICTCIRQYSNGIRLTISLHKPLKMLKLTTSIRRHGNGSVQRGGGGPKVGATIPIIMREGFNPPSTGANPQDLTRQMIKSLRGPKWNIEKGTATTNSSSREEYFIKC